MVGARSVRSCARLALALGTGLALAGAAHAHGAHAGRLAAADARVAAAPESPQPYLERSVLHRDHRDFDAARADLERAAALDPELPALDLLRGELLLAEERPADAVAPLERFVARDPQSPEGRVALARSLARSGRPLRAVPHYDRAIRYAPVPIPSTYLERARTLARAGDAHIDAALAGLDAGMERIGPVPALAREAIRLEVARGHHDAALARLARVTSEPRHAASLSPRGETLEQAERLEKARTGYTGSLRSFERRSVRRGRRR